jgi:hypothetical protein
MDSMGASDVRSGRLLPLLQQHAVEGPQLSALCTGRRRSNSNVRAIFAALVEEFGAR